jgi:hypothetical protein
MQKARTLRRSAATVILTMAAGGVASGPLARPADAASYATKTVGAAVDTTFGRVVSAEVYLFGDGKSPRAAAVPV